MWLENLGFSERSWTLETENECSEIMSVMSKKVEAHCWENHQLLTLRLTSMNWENISDE